MMSVLKIGLFGTFAVRYADQPVSGLDARKVQELLAFLLLQRSRAHSREFLAEMLWGQRAPAQSKKYLRQTLWQVQSALASNGLAISSPLLVDGEWVRVNEGAQIELDVAVFELAYDQAQGVPGSGLDEPRADSLREAVAIYRGDLLPGCYEDWCIFERERLQNMYLAMLDKLIDCCMKHGQYEMGLGYGETILRCDRARERTHRRMMRLYYLAGDRTSALRQYDRCAEALASELDVSPSRSTALLADQIRSEQFPAGDPRLAVTTTPPAQSSDEVLTNVLQRLHQTQKVLALAHRQVQLDIQRVENLLLNGQ
jgi:DNA-binding SARP family transcriptional activator